ncbi:MAG TPA: hypothetical protein VGC12_08670 [Methyloradius sp.]
MISIFDQEKVERETQAQVEITKAFNQEAPKALASFAASKTQPYQDAKDYEHIKSRQADGQELSEYERSRLASLEASGMTTEKSQTTLNDPQAKADYDNWNGNGDYLRAANIIVAAIGGGTTGAATAVTKESLSWAADQMRQKMIEDSMKFPGICVNENDCISNMSGSSVGVNGDGVKVAGGRIVLVDWCSAGGKDACQKDLSTKSGYAENADGTVIFKPIDANGNSLTISQFIDQHQELRSPLGGVQGGAGQMALGIQFEYAAGSFWDKLAEAYVGTHDTLNSIIWCDELGNGRNLSRTLIGEIGEKTNLTNVIVATPFAYSVLLPPEVWNVIFSAIK